MILRSISNSTGTPPPTPHMCYLEMCEGVALPQPEPPHPPAIHHDGAGHPEEHRPPHCDHRVTHSRHLPLQHHLDWQPCHRWLYGGSGLADLEGGMQGPDDQDQLLLGARASNSVAVSAIYFPEGAQEVDQQWIISGATVFPPS